MPKDLLKSVVGSWEGTCRTWFERGKLADESKVKGTIRPILEGLFFRHEYEGTIQGKPRHGFRSPGSTISTWITQSCSQKAKRVSGDLL